jgi:solute carrier family 31 (copper transporter), member 1
MRQQTPRTIPPAVTRQGVYVEHKSLVPTDNSSPAHPMNQTSSTQLFMMRPYLHFTGGDNLFFKSWQPSSRGAIAAASISLLMLAILERLLHTTRGVMDALGGMDPIANIRLFLLECLLSALASNTTRGGAFPSRKDRTIPPFHLYRESARCALYSLQASLSYVLMLAVM